MTQFPVILFNEVTIYRGLMTSSSHIYILSPSYSFVERQFDGRRRRLGYALCTQATT